MKISLIFWDWMKDGKSVYLTEDGVWLSMGQFHSGTIFKGTIELDEEDAEELMEAFKNGFRSAFTVCPK